MSEKNSSPTAPVSSDLEQCRLADAAYEDFNRWIFFKKAFYFTFWLARV